MTSHIIFAAMIAWMTMWLALPSTANDSQDRAVLLEGVSEIAAPGIPGPLAVFGKEALVVAVGKTGSDYRAPVVAASRLGKGRVVAFGHPGYFDLGTLETADTGKLMVNAILWAGGNRKEAGSPRIGVRQQSELQTYLNQQGAPVEAMDGENWLRDLKAVDVICCIPSSLSDKEIRALARYTRSGGGVVSAELGWGWLQLNPGKDLMQHGGNRLFAPAGIVWADGYLEQTSERGYRIEPEPPDFCHAAAALKTIAADSGERRVQKETAQAVWTVTEAMRAIPPDDRLLFPKIKNMRKSRAADLSNAWQKPVTMKEPLLMLLAAMDLEEVKNLPPQRVKPHPAAASFPGSVPVDAPRVTRQVGIDTSVRAWHSTGLYAAPGELIEVESPKELADKNLQVCIGAHTDTLWHLEEWNRAPEITRSFPLKSPVTAAANAFGGAIYIEVPPDCRAGILSLTIRNAIEAPHYVRGETDPVLWREKNRHFPAPWAELEGKRVVLTVPSRVVRNLDDPEGVVEFWDHVVDACADLATVPRERPYKERYVADKQISAGYMHSGYPIMTFLDVIELVVDSERLMREGSWGHFHEMGHNHQSGDWTFDGTGEVTVNLFSMYVYEKVLGKPFDQGHPAIRDRVKRAERVSNYLQKGASFEEWKSDPFLALTMYIQMIEAFGWEPFKKVFAEYRSLPDAERPKNDDEKRDQWMTHFSRATSKNLGPFFQRWGVPTSEKARVQLTDLPVWMPEDFLQATTPTESLSVEIKRSAANGTGHDRSLATRARDMGTGIAFR